MDEMLLLISMNFLILFVLYMIKKNKVQRIYKNSIGGTVEDFKYIKKCIVSLEFYNIPAATGNRSIYDNLLHISNGHKKICTYINIYNENYNLMLTEYNRLREIYERLSLMVEKDEIIKEIMRRR